VTLTTRLIAFYLAALAVVLGCFSATIYALASSHLHAGVNARLRTALDALAAAARIEPGKVVWEPAERLAHLGAGNPDETIYWAVFDEERRLVDQSLASTSGQHDLTYIFVEARPEQPLDVRDRSGHLWRWMRRELVAPESEEEPQADDEVTAPNAVPVEDEGESEAEPQRSQLTVAAAIRLDRVSASLMWLGWALAGTALGIAALAFVGGRWFCRRALAPVTRMAAQAAAMQPAQRDARLVVPPTHDELAALGEALNRLLDQFHQANDRLQRFAGDASHQLRTPLAAMVGQMEVALRQQRTAVQYREALERALGQAQRLARIVETLLMLARLPSGACLSTTETLDLAEALRECAQRWAAHPRTGDLHFDVGGLRENVVAHKELLAQLFDNLIDNALKYSPGGAKVFVRAARHGSHMAVTIIDQGCGIAAEDLPHVFVPFYRSSQSVTDGRPGVGLGLAVAQQIARSFGGDVTVESRIGAGSQFQVLLPLAPQREPDLGNIGHATATAADEACEPAPGAHSTATVAP
jgi:signal transduction histidine kinase